MNAEPGKKAPSAIDLSWMDRGKCVGLSLPDGEDPFFPPEGGTTKLAVSICAQCLVRAECLDYALNTGQKFGIWGGTTDRERERIRRTNYELRQG